MVELLVGIVAVLALCAGLLEVTRITRLHTGTIVDARKSAGLASLLDTPPPRPVGVAPGYIENWQTGPARFDPGDGKRMTRDDSYSDASPWDFDAVLVENAVGSPEGWNVMNEVPVNAIGGLRNAMAPSDLFGLAYGESSAEIDLLAPEYSLVYKLLYRPSSGVMDVRSEAWMTWTKGIY
jgi:hypothetical protein